MPSVLALMDLILSLPASSAEAERGFSVMKRIKSDWRSRLKDDAVSILMMVKLASPDVKHFDPAPAVNVWLSKKRMPEFKDKQRKEPRKKGLLKQSAQETLKTRKVRLPTSRKMVYKFLVKNR